MLLLEASTSPPFLDTKVLRQKNNFQFSHPACRRDEFTCADGTCVPQSAKCNRQFECPDRSDEDDCQQRCRPGEFQCNTGECISSSRKCDRKVDCQDGSDENDCSKLINRLNNVYVAKFCSCRKIYLMSQKYFDLITIGITLSFDHRMIFEPFIPITISTHNHIQALRSADPSDHSNSIPSASVQAIVE